MTAIFISYRRQDTRLIAGRIFEKLEAKLGAGSVFMEGTESGCGSGEAILHYDYNA